MAKVDVEEIAGRLCKECRQVGKGVKFNFTSAEIRFFSINAGIELPYTTEMYTRFSYGVSVLEWNRDDWIVFVRDAINYYLEHSRYVLDRVNSITLCTSDGLSICFLI